jgi:hypothetical protein
LVGLAKCVRRPGNGLRTKSNLGLIRFHGINSDWNGS